MWQIENRTPFQTAGTFLRDENGHEVWCIALRASFQVNEAGQVFRAPDQSPVEMVPRYAGEDMSQTLIAEEDFIPFSPVTDVTLTGAISPQSSAPQPILLQFSVDNKIRKDLLLFPPRQAQFRRGRWHLADVADQIPCPLDWRESFGGAQPEDDQTPPENPVGKGLALRSQRPEGTLIDLPRIEAAGSDCLRDPKQATAANYCPMPRWWQGRITRAGTFDAGWQQARAPLMPLDHDRRFACAAPLDQLPATHLKGGETVTLQGFQPGPALMFRLPQLVLRAETVFDGGVQRQDFYLGRVNFDLGTGLLHLVWLSALRCDGRDHLIKRSRVSLQQISGVQR